MARPRSTPPAGGLPLTPAMLAWAEALGEAFGRGAARTLGAAAAAVGGGNGAPRRRGRPPKAQTGGPVPPERRCTKPGCDREARSKGLCSAHYQAARREALAKGK